jgi:DNA modification methylase
VAFVGDDDVTAKAYALADNRTAELGSYDEPALINLIEEVHAVVPEFVRDAGWSDDAIAELVAKIESEQPLNEIDEDEIPEPPVEPITKLGDIWQLGRHRLMCGDSTDIKQIDKLTLNQKAIMAFTDPPYNTGMSSKTNAGSTRLNHFFDDNFSEEEWAEFLPKIVYALDYCTEINSVSYITFGWKRNHELIPILQKYFKVSNIIIWDKVVHGLGSDYQYTYELVNVCKKGKPKIDSHQGDNEYQDVWHIQRQLGKNKDHATAKPVELCERAIRHASHKNQIIIDLFGGSGSTLIAAEQIERICYMMELSPKYCDVIIKRWENLTGEKAVLVPNAESA